MIYINIIGAFDRTSAEGLNPRKGRSVIISITSPNSSFPLLQEGWSDILRLSFDDIDHEDGQNYIIFSDSQAEEILDFAIKNIDKDLFVNCDAGISRSTAIVVALELIFNSNDVSDSYKYQHHNKYVKNKIRDVWFKRIWSK